MRAVAAKVNDNQEAKHHTNMQSRDGDTINSDSSSSFCIVRLGTNGEEQKTKQQKITRR